MNGPFASRGGHVADGFELLMLGVLLQPQEVFQDGDRVVAALPGQLPAVQAPYGFIPGSGLGVGVFLETSQKVLRKVLFPQPWGPSKI